MLFTPTLYCLGNAITDDSQVPAHPLEVAAVETCCVVVALWYVSLQER